jgi:transposase-like protein
MRQLSIHSGYSISTIRRIIEYGLLHPPCATRDLSTYRYLIFDGTILKHRRGVFAVMDAETCSVLYGEPDISEGPPDLSRFCVSLAQRKLSPKSATVDGNKQLIKILRQLWPKIIIQRCLVHIQRQGLMWCRINPKRTDAKHLRELFLQVMSIHTKTDRDRFLSQVKEWEQKYGQRIAASPETGWVFSDLKHARSMLLSALPDMFHYLDDPNIPKSTNALEGYFSRMKQKYLQHRGLVKPHRDSYFTWYLHLSPR